MILKTVKALASTSKVTTAFLGGLALGTVGLEVLASKEAKRGYAKVIAKGYKAKDGIDATISGVKQHTDDVLADAKDLYEAEKQEENLSLIEAEVTEGE